MISRNRILAYVRYAALWVGACAVALACSEDADSNDSGGWFPGGPNVDSDGAPTGGTGAPGSAAPPGDEQEVPVRFEQPAAGERYLYVANPTRSNVAVIDAQTFAIELAQAGDKPTFLTTLGGRDVAVVLNVGSGDASVLRTDSAGTRTHWLDVVDGANTIAVAPDGKHAVVYFDSLGPPTGSVATSLQDVTVLSFGDTGTQDRAVDISVGFRPRSVKFHEDGSKAFVITEDGVSVLDFVDIEQQGPAIAPLVRLDQTGLDVVDVSVTPDGGYAVARRQGQSEVRLVSLDDGQIRVLDLSSLVPETGANGEDADGGVDGPTSAAPVTDIELAPSGEFAMAVVRATGDLYRIPVPSGFTDPTQVTRLSVEGVVIGSIVIAPTGDRAIAYTNASDEERIVVVDLAETAVAQIVRLRKTVRGVAITDDGRTAFVVHRKAPGSPTEPGLDPDSVLARSYGYSLLRLDTGYVKLEPTATDLGAFVTTPDSAQLFVLLGDETATPPIRQVQMIELSTFIATSVALGGAPRSVGVVSGPQRIFVGQDNPEGRITFIDWSTGEERTSAGFELNSRVRN